jgi:hypothetical protein
MILDNKSQTWKNRGLFFRVLYCNIIIDGRNVLHWNDGSVKVLDKKISSANYKKQKKNEN